MKTSSKFVLRESKSKSFVQAVWQGIFGGSLQPSTSFDPTDATLQLNIKVLASAANDPTTLYIGDLVEISFNYPKVGILSIGGFIEPGKIPITLDASPVWRTVLMTASAYCNASSDPTCQRPTKGPGSDWGKPVCLDTVLYLMQVKNDDSYQSGYWLRDGATIYVSKTDFIPGPKLTSFFLIPLDSTTCSSGKCVPFTNFVNYDVTCDSSCVCVDSSNNYVFPSSSSCNCSGPPPSSASYGCCPGKGCVKLDNNNGLPQVQCNSLCQVNTTFDCNAAGYCVPTANGKYKNDPTCGGSCKSLTTCSGSSKSSSTKIIIIIFVILILLIAVYFIYKKFFKKK